jgi:hypothetical protein
MAAVANLQHFAAGEAQQPSKSYTTSNFIKGRINAKVRTHLFAICLTDSV